MLFIVMKLSLLVYNTVGEGGSDSCSSDAKMPGQRIFVLSDPGVPRSFVVNWTFRRLTNGHLKTDNTNNTILVNQFLLIGTLSLILMDNHYQF